jgi:glycerate-2-kinase
MIDFTSHIHRQERALLTEWFTDAMLEMLPGTRFEQNARLHGDVLEFPGSTVNLGKYENIWLFGAGKGAFSLSRGVLRVLGRRISGGVVIGPASGDVTAFFDSHVGVPASSSVIIDVVSSRSDEHLSNLLSGYQTVQFLPGDHPVPLSDSVESTQLLLDYAKRVQPNDLVLFVLTGGASAMLCKPTHGMTLEFKQQRFRKLLESGASIQEMNAARKELSMVKGGRLLQFFSGADVVNFIVSDVPGDDLHTIGSAPTQPDPVNSYPGTVTNCLIATPGQVANLIATYAQQAGYSVMVQKDAYAGTSEDVAEAICTDIDSVLAKVRVEPNANDNVAITAHVLIYHGESEVLVKGNGKGGRNQHLALQLATRFHSYPGRITLLSAGTDGIDGNTLAAGAFCTELTTLIAREKGLNPAEFLQNFDSNSFFKQIGDIFQPGPTGTNFADLQIVIVH